jgi:SAM-dependent methyltransferase
LAIRPCPACLSLEARPAGSSGDFDLFRCPGCKTLFTGTLPASSAEAHDYSAYYHEANLRIPEWVEQRLEKVAGAFESYRRTGNWLDVGCGAGALMRAARNRGWNAVGTEVAETAAEAVRAQSFEVHVGELTGLPLEDGSFDVVSLVEVVEHVEDPRSLVADAARLIRPGGAMYVTTPHGRGISARLLRSRWSAVAPPEHLQLLSVAGLRAMFGHAGLRPRRIRTHAVNPHELLSALRRSGGATGNERVESGYALNESLQSSRGGALLKASANGALNLLRLGDAIKAEAVRAP